MNYKILFSFHYINNRVESIMAFIVYQEPPPDLKSYFHKVETYDPIKNIMSSFSSFDNMVAHLQDDFECYGIFIGVRHTTNFTFVRHTNFFVQKQRILGGVLEPVSPFYIYRRSIRHSQSATCFTTCQHLWMIENILTKMLSTLDTTTTFTAGDEMRDIPTNSLIKNELNIQVEPVPLLVITTPQKSLDVAEFIVRMMHSTSSRSIINFFNENRQIINHLSIDLRRKMYDIFPEEYIHIPDHIIAILKNIDDYEFTQDDVAELFQKYQQLQSPSSL